METLAASARRSRSASHRDTDLRDALARSFEAVQIDYSNLRTGYDVDAIKHERTVRGQFVRDVLAWDASMHERKRVLAAGLRAFDGRDDLDVV